MGSMGSACYGLKGGRGGGGGEEEEGGKGGGGEKVGIRGGGGRKGGRGGGGGRKVGRGGGGGKGGGRGGGGGMQSIWTGSWLWPLLLHMHHVIMGSYMHVPYIHYLPSDKVAVQYSMHACNEQSMLPIQCI